MAAAAAAAERTSLDAFAAGSFVPLAKTVKNDGPTARDHLSNERTLLAWVRTSVAMLALGLAVAKFSQPRVGTADDPSSIAGAVMGASLTCLGCTMVIYAQRRYLHVAEGLQRGEFHINTGESSHDMSTAAGQSTAPAELDGQRARAAVDSISLCDGC